MVAIDEGATWNCKALKGDKRLTFYSPIGQHSEGTGEYLSECIEITKEQYLNASKVLYTPIEYLEGVKK
jgi:hypothetical protein